MARLVTSPVALVLAAVTLVTTGCGEGSASGAGSAASTSGTAVPASRSLVLDGRAIDDPAVTVTRTGSATYRVVVDEPRAALDFTVDVTEHLFDSGTGPDLANAVGASLEGSEHARSLRLTRAVLDGRPVIFTPACYPPDTHMLGSLTRLDSRMEGRFTLFALFDERRADHCGARLVELSVSAPIDATHP